jgi:hypothetical protein
MSRTEHVRFGIGQLKAPGGRNVVKTTSVIGQSLSNWDCLIGRLSENCVFGEAVMKGDAGRITRPDSIDLEQFAEATVGAVIRAIDARFQGPSGQIPSKPYFFQALSFGA